MEKRKRDSAKQRFPIRGGVGRDNGPFGQRQSVVIAPDYGWHWSFIRIRRTGNPLGEHIRRKVRKDGSQQLSPPSGGLNPAKYKLFFACFVLSSQLLANTVARGMQVNREEEDGEGVEALNEA